MVYQGCLFGRLSACWWGTSCNVTGLLEVPNLCSLVQLSAYFMVPVQQIKTMLIYINRGHLLSAHKLK